MNALTETRPSEVAASQPTGAAGSLLNVIAEAAQNPNTDVAKLEALLNMQERVLGREAEREFNAALSRLSSDMPRVTKYGKIDLGKGRPIPFAKWEDVDAVIRPRMQAEGFVLTFSTRPKQGDGGGIIVVGRLLHRGGHHQEVDVPLPLDSGPGRNNLQAMGSTLSYGKRYAAELLLNIVRENEDDDGVRGGTVYISVAQKDELIGLMQETKADTGAFLRYLDVRSLDEIEAGQFVAARSALEKKRQVRGAGQAKP